MLCCDASLAVELSLDRVGEDAGMALGNEELIAAPLLWSEVPSVLREMVFRGEISSGLGERALRRFLDGKSRIAERRPEGLAMRAWLASELGWAKTYDAEYLGARRPARLPAGHAGHEAPPRRRALRVRGDAGGACHWCGFAQIRAGRVLADDGSQASQRPWSANPPMSGSRGPLSACSMRRKGGTRRDDSEWR